MTVEYIYVARNKLDDSVRGYAWDDIGFEKSTAKTVALWIKELCYVERFEATEENLSKIKFTDI